MSAVLTSLKGGERKRYASPVVRNDRVRSLDGVMKGKVAWILQNVTEHQNPSHQSVSRLLTSLRRSD